MLQWKKKKYKEEKVCVRKVKEGYSGAGMVIQGLATDGGHDFLLVHFAFYNNPLNCIILFCHVRLFATPWTVARQAPPSLKFSRQEHWSGLPFPSPGDLPDPGIAPGLLHCRQTLHHLSHWWSSLSRVVLNKIYFKYKDASYFHIECILFHVFKGLIRIRNSFNAVIFILSQTIEHETLRILSPDTPNLQNI